MATRTITVVSAGLHNPSSTKLLADQIAQAVGRATTACGAELNLEHVELRTLAHEITDALLAGFPTGDLKRVIERVHTSDALVAVTPTFQASYAGLFKSFVDLLDVERLRGKPVLLGATGGTERHTLVMEFALRPLFAYLGTEPVPTGIFAATSDFADGTLSTRIDRAATQLAEALAAELPPLPAGATAAPDDPDDVVPFEQLFQQLTR